MDIRKVGIWMVALGGIAVSVGIVTDAVQQADDPTLAQREGIFDLSRFAHALFFGGLCVAIIGLFVLLVGNHLYGRTDRVTVGRRILQIGAPIGAVVLLAATAAAASDSSLGEPSGSTGTTEADTTAAEATDATATAEDGHAHAGDEAAAHDHDEPAADGGHGNVIEGTATGDSPCEVAQPTPASPGQVGAGEGGSEEVIGEHGNRGMVVQEPLTPEERAQLAEQMAQARAVAEKYPTVAAAEADGYRRSTPYVPCIGAHYTKFSLVPAFDPAAPSELLFDGTAPEAKIVGLSYLNYNPGGPPEGFAGANDHWHQHNANGGLCFGDGRGVIGGEAMTEAECEALGGEKRELTDIWMTHAWVVPGFECSWGVFAGECPELGGRTGGTAWDEPTPDDDDVDV